MLSHLLALSAVFHSYILAYFYDWSLCGLWLLVTFSVGYFTLGRDKVIVLFCIVSSFPLIYHLNTLQNQVAMPHGRFVLSLKMNVVGDSVRKEWGSKTLFIVDEVLDCGALISGVCNEISGKKVEVNSYQGGKFQAGQKIAGKVVLKPVFGFLNPGGFDYEHWMFTRGIWAKGYFSGEIQLISNSVDTRWANRLGRFLDSSSGASGVNNGEGSKDAGVNFSTQSIGILRALLLGDRSLLEAKDKSLLVESGLIHLFVISGLHIGLLFGVAFLFLKTVLVAIGVCFQSSVQRFSNAAACLSLFMVAWYVDQIGYPIPALRALLFLVIWMAARFLRAELSIYQLLSLAAFLILSLFPAELFSYGFWMSFLAVLALSFSLVGIQGASSDKSNSKDEGSFYSFQLNKWKQRGTLVLRPQCFVLLMLFPLMTGLGSQASLMALIWNIICIPIFAVVIVPSLMIAASVFDVLPVFSSLVFEYVSNGIIWFLDFLALTNRILPVFVEMKTGAPMLLLLVCVLLILLPLARRLRVLAALLVVVLMTVRPHQKSELDVWFLDVGQALSVVLIKNQKAFIYDTGFAYGSFNAADSVIVPFLKRQGVDEVEVLVVSHKDLDHSGGMLPLMKSSYSPLMVLQNFSDHFSLKGKSVSCGRSTDFEWQGVVVKGLWPINTKDHNEKHETVSSNDSSCVLLLDYRGEQILLTGDISRRVEARLVSDYAKAFTNVRIMSAPHHGSKSSSSVQFVRAVSPSWAVFSSGPLNRFGHPHKDVQMRYQESEVSLFNTAQQGAVYYSLENGGKLHLNEVFLEDPLPYWRTIRQAP